MTHAGFKAELSMDISAAEAFTGPSIEHVPAHLPDRQRQHNRDKGERF